MMFSVNVQYFDFIPNVDPLVKGCRLSNVHLATFNHSEKYQNIRLIYNCLNNLHRQEEWNRIGKKAFRLGKTEKCSTLTDGQTNVSAVSFEIGFRAMHLQVPMSDHLNGEISKSPFARTFWRGFWDEMTFWSVSNQQISGCGRPAAFWGKNERKLLGY